MNDSMLSDAREHPLLFRWNGGIAREEIDRWAALRGWKAPDDLLALWEATGGGDLFETETLLGPLAESALADDVDSVNEVERGRGLSSDYVIFHVGLGGFSAVKLSDGRYVTLRPDHLEDASYPTLDAWYLEFLRPEYEARYGLGARLNQ